jgi:hypothetical protein
MGDVADPARAVAGHLRIHSQGQEESKIQEATHVMVLRDPTIRKRARKVKKNCLGASELVQGEQ